MPKAKANRLTENERLVVIEELEKPQSRSKLAIAKSYNVSEGAIRKLWKNRETIKQRASSLSVATMNRKRDTPAKYPEMEKYLYEWIQLVRQAKQPLSPSLVLKRAEEYAEKHEISEFKASWKWLSRFRKRTGLKCVQLHGEGAEVNRSDPVLLDALDNLYQCIRNYRPDHVYNMDECALFYRMVPRYSVLLPNESSSEIRGLKIPKDRVSLIMSTNATGTHKIPCVMVGKARSPVCVRGRSWPIPYLNQKRAWVDIETCTKWFNEVFYPEIEKQTNNPVLLLIDNAPGHFRELVKGNVTVKCLPPNCTSWKQPLDLGLIAAFKKRYKHLYLKDVVEFYGLQEEVKDSINDQARQLRRGVAGIAHGRSANLLDAAYYVKRAWESITETTIQNCFRKAELGLSLPCANPSGDNDDFSDFIHLLQNLSLDINRDELNDFINADDESNPQFAQVINEEIEKALNESNADTSELFESDESMNFEDDENENFRGYGNVLSQGAKMEKQLASSSARSMAPDTYDELRCAHEKFLKLLRNASLEEKENSRLL